MLRPASVLHHVIEVVAFCAQGVRTITRRIERWVLDGIDNQRSWTTRREGAGSYLAEFIPPFEDVKVPRSMRSIRTGAPELPIGVAVVAIRAENAIPHRTHRNRAGEIPHG